MELIVFGLIVACVTLWRKSASLSRRVDALELAIPAAEVTPGWTSWSPPKPRAAGSSPQRTLEPLGEEIIPNAFPAFAGTTGEERSAPPEALDAAEIPKGDQSSSTTPSSQHTLGWLTEDEPTPTVLPAPVETTDEAPVSPQPAPPRATNFEELFGRTLPIWAGGVTLAVAGFLLVKYSIEAGLLSPAIRVLSGLLFGSGLIAGAEAALREEARVRDPRVRQALAGAGVATLYASVLVAADVYHLVPPAVAFAGLAAVTALAGFLSLRFGAPSAVLGLVGGLAAPALVGAGPPDVPLLSLYLALAVGGLCTLGRTQRWMWLGAGALVGGFGWGVVLILGGALDVADSLSVGALLFLLGIALPVLMFPGGRGTVVRAGGALAACAQMAALVAGGGFAALDWGLFALLSVAIVWLSRRERMLADVPAAALAVGLMLAGVWPEAHATGLACVIAGAVLIFGAPAAWRMWRDDARLSDAVQVAALAFAVPVLPVLHWVGRHWTGQEWQALAGLAALGATLAGGVAARGWRAERRGVRFALLVTAAAVLIGLTGTALLPWWATAAWLAVVSGGVLLLGHRAADERLEPVAWAGAAATLAGMAIAGGAGPQLARALGEVASVGDARDLIGWAIPAGVAALFAWRGRARGSDVAAQPVAVLLGYVAVAQITHAQWLPVVPAAALAALAWRATWRPAIVTAAALAIAWAAWPFALWLAVAGGALIGVPLFVTALPSLSDVALRLVLPALAVAVVGWRSGDALARRIAWSGSALVAGIALHVAYKQLFAIASFEAFVARGMAERTGWEALLAAAAFACHRRAPRVALAFGAAALFHFAWFTGLLHNPLWSAQAVGDVPVANLLLPAYGIAFAGLGVARMAERPGVAGTRLGADGADAVVRGVRTVSSRARHVVDPRPDHAGRGHRPIRLRDRGGGRLPAVGHSHRRARLADRLPAVDAGRGRQGVPVRCVGPHRRVPHRLVRRARLQPDRRRLALQPRARRAGALTLSSLLIATSISGSSHHGRT